MQLISKYSKGIRYLLCAIDLFSKYAFDVPLRQFLFWTVQTENQIRYGLIKAVNFTTSLLKNG